MTDILATALILLAYSLLSGCSTYSVSGHADVSREVAHQLREQCIRNQTMQHGMGGQVPNYSTC